MKLTFLGKDSTPNDSPTLYATDRDTYLVQGYTVTDPEAWRRCGFLPVRRLSRCQAPDEVPASGGAAWRGSQLSCATAS